MPNSTWGDDSQIDNELHLYGVNSLIVLNEWTSRAWLINIMRTSQLIRREYCNEGWDFRSMRLCDIDEMCQWQAWLFLYDVSYHTSWPKIYNTLFSAYAILLIDLRFVTKQKDGLRYVFSAHRLNQTDFNWILMIIS